MRRIAAVFLLVLASAMALLAAAPKEHYIATVLLPDTMRGNGVGPTAQLEIGIERFTPDSVMDDLGAILGDGNNQQALLDKFEKMHRSGWVYFLNRPTWDVKVIRETKTSSGREITLVTDRPIGFWEAQNSPVTQTYPYGMMKFTVNDKGFGSGEIYPMVRIKSIGPSGITLQDYGVVPIQVPNVQLIK